VGCGSDGCCRGGEGVGAAEIEFRGVFGAADRSAGGKGLDGRLVMDGRIWVN
jgi:hypothetical protein